MQSFTTTFTTDRSPQQVFDAITDVRGWWTGEIEGVTDELGATFTYRYAKLHRSTQTITELVPGTRIAWHVDDAELAFVADRGEWKGTDIVFDIARRGDKTEVRFTHVGLTASFECFDKCSSAWGYYIRDCLPSFIASRA